jgi:hypothetical protein
MKLKEMTNQVTLTESESKFLINVLLDWEQSQKNMSKTEKQTWSHLLSVIDPYLQK